MPVKYTRQSEERGTNTNPLLAILSCWRLRLLLFLILCFFCFLIDLVYSKPLEFLSLLRSWLRFLVINLKMMLVYFSVGFVVVAVVAVVAVVVFVVVVMACFVHS